LQSLQDSTVACEMEGCNTFTGAMIPCLAGASVMPDGLIDYGTGAVYDLQPDPLYTKMACEKKVAASW
jgi:hypothetical protein